MEAAVVEKLIAGYGALGVLTVGLGVAVKVLWRKNEDLHLRLQGVQDARLAERDTMVKALADNNRLLEEITDIIK